MGIKWLRGLSEYSRVHRAQINFGDLTVVSGLVMVSCVLIVFFVVPALVGVTAVVDVPTDTCAAALVGVPAVVGVTAMVDVPTDY